MNTTLLMFMAGLNAGVAADYFLSGNPGMAIVFFSYATACVGFIISNLGLL